MMILVRNVFRLKFGKMREALALWQEGAEIERRSGGGKDMRLLTDMTGPFYTLVMEQTFDGLADMEREFSSTMNQDEWRAWYARFTPLVEDGYREMFNVVSVKAPSLPMAERKGAAVKA